MFNINYDAILKKLNLRKDKPRDEDLATVRVVSHGKYNPDLESQRLHEVVTTQDDRYFHATLLFCGPSLAGKTSLFYQLLHSC